MLQVRTRVRGLLEVLSAEPTANQPGPDHRQDSRYVQVMMPDQEGRVREDRRQGNFDERIVFSKAYDPPIERGDEGADADASHGHPDKVHGSADHRQRTDVAGCSHGENDGEEHDCGGVIE
jgi:hypothetical protein